VSSHVTLARVGESDNDRAASSPRPSLRNLKPAWFASVMATGIVARAVTGAGWPWGGTALLIIGLITFAGLTIGMIARAIRYPREMAADAGNPSAGFTYLTFVAGAAVLSTGLSGHGLAVPALMLLAVALVSWLILCYLIPAGFMVHHNTAPGMTGADGTWLLWVVGTQSLAVAASALPAPWAHRFATPALLIWSIGSMLYGIVAALVLGALFSRELTPATLVPPYWIFMGATAISVLAAATLIDRTSDHLVTLTHPVLIGAAVVLWAFGTWLIPALLIGCVWRYLIEHFRRGFDPSVWSIVFPIGMYGVGTREFGLSVGESWMATFGRAEAWVGLAAWVVVAVATVVRYAPGLRRVATSG
jgi:tellurite resistance protein TehA-like permease